MLEAMGSEGAYRTYAVSACEDLDIPELTEMIRLAWQRDYADAPRPDFDESCLQAMMTGPYWIAVLIVDANDKPVAFEVAFERRIRCAGWAAKAYYASVLSVHPDHRRRGLGRALVSGINRLAIEQGEAALVFSTFHQGHAGSPTVQATFDDIPGWDVVRFHGSSMWRRRLGSRSRGGARISDDVPRALPVLLSEADDSLHLTSDENAVLATRLDIEHRVQKRCAVAFELAADYRREYFEPNPRGGSLWCDAGGVGVLVPYSIWQIEARPDVMVTVGVIQGAVAMNGEPNSLGAHLEQVAAFFQDIGCVAVSAPDLGLPGERDLIDAGFECDDEDRIWFAVRGPADVVHRFSRIETPFFLDFT
jgi:GNAT superfamily N-acetyltransferase